MSEFGAIDIQTAEQDQVEIVVTKAARLLNGSAKEALYGDVHPVGASSLYRVAVQLASKRLVVVLKSAMSQGMFRRKLLAAVSALVKFRDPFGARLQAAVSRFPKID